MNRKRVEEITLHLECGVNVWDGSHIAVASESMLQ